MLKVLIDCDPGIDDAAALILALRSGALDVLAVTTVSGNLRADVCARNALRILDLLGRADIPVSAGAMTPLAGVLQPDPFSHGADGLADLGLPEPTVKVDERDAASVMVDLANAHANAHEGRLHIIGLGPLTNVARALAIDPDLPAKVECLTIIGGAYGLRETASTRATGANPVSEWNIGVDPEAAAIVLAAGFDLVALGLDVTTSDDAGFASYHRAILSRSADPAASFLLATDAFVRGRGFGGYCALIDAFAVAAVIRPDLVTTRRLRVGVETTGSLTRGQTVVDRREHFQWLDLPEIKVVDSVRCTEILDMIVDAAAGTVVQSSGPVAGPGEEELAASIATALRPHIRPDSRFQFDTSAFIPDFAGADEATFRLCALPAYRAARRILVTPDNALISFRAQAIADGKTLIMPSYGLVRGFLTLGAQLSALPLPFAAWLDGMEHFAHETTLAELREAGPIGLVVAGASAVTEQGVRFGMGHRYLDVEWGLLAELDLVDAGTPIAVIVHDIQLTKSAVRPAAHSVGADIIATPTRLVLLPRAMRPKTLFEGLAGPALSTSAPIVERARMVARR